MTPAQLAVAESACQVHRPPVADCVACALAAALRAQAGLAAQLANELRAHVKLGPYHICDLGPARPPVRSGQFNPVPITYIINCPGCARHAKDTKAMAAWDESRPLAG